MAYCGSESNTISLDAYQIGNIVFSTDDISHEYKESLRQMLSSLDLRTLFEMLMIVTTEGMKKLYGNGNQTVDISLFTDEHINIINSFLNKINFTMLIDVIPAIEWNSEDFKKKKSYKETIISTSTKLEDLNYILERNDFVIISFMKN